MQLLRDQVGFRVYPIHRLDKPTSGILLFATSPKSANVISDLFAARLIEKTYQAVVRGWTPERDTIDYALKEILDRTTDGKARADKPPQSARTTFQTIARCEAPHPVGRYETARYSLVAIHPETGRKNQIRRHFKHIFHPVVGDRNSAIEPKTPSSVINWGCRGCCSLPHAFRSFIRGRTKRL